MAKLTPTRGMATADTPFHDPRPEAQLWPVLWPVVGPPQPQTSPQARKIGLQAHGTQVPSVGHADGPQGGSVENGAGDVSGRCLQHPVRKPRAASDGHSETWRSAASHR